MNEPLVTITGMDATASRPSGEGALVDVHLNITNPPEGWATLFDQVWNQHYYSMKREARATSRHIVIRCVPSELQGDHIPELKKVISTTNEEYCAATAADNQSRKIQEAKEQKFKDELIDLANKLKV